MHTRLPLLARLNARLVETRRSLPFVVLFVSSVVAARATSVVAPSFSELVSEAQVIVRAEIVSVRSAWVESAQGPVIKTFVTLAVKKSLKEKRRPR